ncbi:MAG: GAF domain-containing protein [Syntrophaceae bacterium]|nr:GAF domain-containing protein [Syntrophaceae bacterium]
MQDKAFGPEKMVHPSRAHRGRAETSGPFPVEPRADEGVLQGRDEALLSLAQENGIIAAIGRIISSTPNIEKVYERFAEEVKKLIPFDRLAVNLNDLGRGLIVNAYAAGIAVSGRQPGDLIPLAGSLNERILHTRESFLIQSEDGEEVAKNFPSLLSTFQAGFRSLLSVPLIASDEVIGALHFRSIQPKAYAPNHVRLAEGVAAQIAGAIALARLLAQRKSAEMALKKSEEEARRLAQENAVMAEIGRIICSTLDIESVYQRFSETVRKLIRFDRLAINIIEPDSRTFSIPYVWGTEIPGRRANDSIPLAGTAAEEVFRTRSSLLMRKEDRGEFARRFPGLLPILNGGIQSFLMVPLVSQDRVIGVLNVLSAQESSYTWEDLNLAEKVGDQIAGAIASSQIFAKHHQALKALKESEEKYRLLIQNSSEAIFIAQDGVIKFPNIQTQKMLGYSAEELVTIPFVAHIHEDDRQVVVERHRKRIQGLKAPNTYSFRIKNRQGKELWAEINAVLIEWEGRPATLNFVRDMTEQKKLEAQFLQAQKMEAVGQLAGGIAHDFNNLLTIINTHSELALMELKEWDPLREKFEAIHRAGEKAADLTRKLLAFSRHQVGAMKVIDLNRIVEDLEKMLHRVIGEDIQLTTFFSKDLGHIKADPGQIEHTLLNLVVNARDAMPSGGRLEIKTVNVQVDEENPHPPGIKRGDYVMLSVTDTGVGMNPEVQERIFEPFFTTKEKGKGTGLGLSTVYGIIKQTGGHIWVSSEPGKGTTFEIYFPRVDEPLPESQKATSPGILGGGRETILIVEDEEGVRKLTRKILSRQGYKILEASSGGDALLLCEQWSEPIHLILSDVVMPGINGPELARRLQALSPGVKVLFMSGYADQAIFQSGILEEKASFIQKPFSARDLVEKIREVIGNC